MDSLQIVVLAVVQGITEFLPISSSGHLILIPFFADWPDQGLEFDVAVHIGTLSAIVVSCSGSSILSVKIRHASANRAALKA